MANKNVTGIWTQDEVDFVSALRHLDPQLGSFAQSYVARGGDLYAFRDLLEQGGKAARGFLIGRGYTRREQAAG